MAVALLAVTATMRSIMTAQPFTSMHSLMERYLARQQPMAGEDFVAKAEGKVATTGTTADHAGRQLAQDPVFVGRILASEKTSGVSNSEHGTVRWAKAVAQDAGRPTAPMILFLGTAKRQRGWPPPATHLPTRPIRKSRYSSQSLSSSRWPPRQSRQKRWATSEEAMTDVQEHQGSKVFAWLRIVRRIVLTTARDLLAVTVSMRSIMSGHVARPLTRAWCRKSKCSGPSPMRDWIRVRLALFSSIDELLERYLALQRARSPRALPLTRLRPGWLRIPFSWAGFSMTRRLLEFWSPTMVRSAGRGARPMMQPEPARLATVPTWLSRTSLSVGVETGVPP